ncbi:MAG: hypothetical protein QGI21_02455 [Candidatus Poseidoniaceae archaeon]|jgi:hypothetical protein|nr:hypothetical protein [Candidatus Poseidoniaceae archaeon]
MSGLEENLGPGYKQIVIGLIVFAIGALWGLLIAQEDPIQLGNLYASAVIMLSGAIMVLLGTTFGTNNSQDRASDLPEAFGELSTLMENVQKMLTGNNNSEDE